MSCSRIKMVLLNASAGADTHPNEFTLQVWRKAREGQRIPAVILQVQLPQLRMQKDHRAGSENGGDIADHSPGNPLA